AWAWIRRARALEGHPYRLVPVFAAAWVTVEQARSLWPFGGFPWGRLAFSQTDAPLLALASLGGAPLVSAVVAGCGALVAQAWLDLRDRRTGRAGAAGLATAALVGCGLLVVLPGPDDAGAAGESAASKTLRIAAVQGNVARPGLDAFATRREVLRNHVAGTAAVVDDVGPGELDVILWPENSADVDPRTDALTARLIDDAALDAGAPILVGTLRYDDRGRYNDAVLWVGGQGPVAEYTKQHPAPFAEYIPMRGIARIFSNKVDLVRTDMLPGTEVGVVPLPVERLGRTVPLADVICFEVAYDSLVRDAVLAGGEIIVVQTNNASFGLTPESTQQLAMTRLRAVEHGRTAVQISTVGVSGIFGPDGSVRERTGLFTAEQMVDEVPLRTTVTVADRLGDWPLWIAAAVTAVALAAGLAAGSRRAGVDNADALKETVGRTP
ncbi:MAG TPA: apolipoprotein N-acyltransferase, partial [Actinotalea sp.]|nr:apolipoprotein N-acyltransferase [Actinotalea sp.]